MFNPFIKVFTQQDDREIYINPDLIEHFTRIDKPSKHQYIAFLKRDIRFYGNVVYLSEDTVQLLTKLHFSND